MVTNIEEITNVVERVLDLLPRQWPFSPVGTGLFRIETDREDFLNQIRMGHRISESEQARRKLNVEYAAGHGTASLAAKVQFFLPCMYHEFAIRTRYRFPELAEIIQCQRIDDREDVVGGHLDQTKGGKIGVFRHEFGIDSDPLRCRQMATKIAQFTGSSNEEVFSHTCHDTEWYTVDFGLPLVSSR